MRRRMYDEARGRWYSPNEKVWDENSQSWIDPRPKADPYVLEGLYYPRFLGEGTVLTRTVENMPLASNSAQIAQWSRDNALNTEGGAWGSPTALNTSSYAIPIYIVDSSRPHVQTQKVDIGQGGLSSSLYAMLEGDIPMPTWTRVAGGGDRAFSVYDKSTGVMREYFNCTRPLDANGQPINDQWRCATGGYSLTEPGLDRLFENNYAVQLREGSNAVVKMHNPIGQIGIAEARAGEIKHALQFTASNAKLDKAASRLIPGADPNLSSSYDIKIGAYSWPAQMGDGFSADENALTQGQWFRLPPDLDPDDIYYNFEPFTRLLIRAAQKYGGFATDKNLWCHAFNAEPPYVEEQYFGQNPWEFEKGDVWKKYGGFDIADFPWELTEWAPVDWGKPTTPGPFPSPVH